MAPTETKQIMTCRNSTEILGIICQRAQDEVVANKEKSKENIGPSLQNRYARSLKICSKYYLCI